MVSGFPNPNIEITKATTTSIVIGYAGMIASEVASEKTSRVMEILVIN